MAIEMILIVALVISVLAEYMDATIGMGYGTTLTPILLLIGFSPLQVVPAILLAQFTSGIFAAILHQNIGNVHFDFSKDTEHRITKRLGMMGYIPKSQASQVALMLTISSMIGILIAVPIALLLPIFYFRLYIGILIVTMGVIIVSKYNSRSKFSWKKIMGLGSLAAFNKGLSGGGYGPIIVSGQMLSGIDTKNSIGITALSEGATCFIGVITYFVLGTHIDWVLAPYLLIGSSISVPISVYSVKKIPLKRLTLIIGLATIILGTFSLIQSFSLIQLFR